MSKVFSVRLPDGEAARVEEISAARSIKPTAWLKEAVASYLDDHERGLPDAPASEPARIGRPPKSASQTTPGRVTAGDDAALERERLAILAQARASVVRRGS
jgi:hypothetical protein